MLEYNELIVAPAVVRIGSKVGGWISQIYVDNPDSVAAGREIWGLPKELAEFNRSPGKTIVTQRDLTLCSSIERPQLWSALHIRSRLSGNCFGNLNGELLSFGNNFQARLSAIDCQLEIPATSPFANLNLARPLLALSLQDLNLVTMTPAPTGVRLKN